MYQSNSNASNSQQRAIRSDIVALQMPKAVHSLIGAGQQSETRLKKHNVSLAKRLVLRQLGAMSKGHLCVYEGGQKLEFGSNDQNVSTRRLDAEIVVHDQNVYKRMMLNGVLGAAESYIEGEWTTPDLVAVVRFFVSNLQELEAMNGRRTLVNKIALALLSYVTRNTLKQSKQNISAHYDLGNDFFSLFLDPTMLYSSAVFGEKNISLEEASTAKMDRLCQKLQLTSSDHLLEIGTGWGAMAVYAAQEYGCRVTTTTISEEQYQYARALVESKGLGDRVHVLKQDYRALQGQYDKLVSIEMIEAVGHQFFQQYFSTCSNLLKPNGVMAIQAITMPDQRYATAVKNVDFIKRYIFPGGCLPSLSVIADHVAKDTDMVISDIYDITADYATTLAHWRDGFFQNIDAVREQGFDERFVRMWDYYLCYCEGGFRERVIGTHQIVMTKPQFRD